MLTASQGFRGLPIQLHGDATFDGSGTGSLVDPAFKGHLTANQFSTFVLPAFREPLQPASKPAAGTAPAADSIYWDGLDTNASYSSSLISVDHATLTRGKTVIHASGSTGGASHQPAASGFR